MLKFLRLAPALLLLALAPAAQAKPPLWIIRDADSTIVLFGSVHALPQGLDWQPAELRSALAEADDLWFEILNDPATQQRAAQLSARLGLLPAGQKLSSRLAPKTLSQLERVAARLSIPMARLEAYRPWMAEVLIAVTYVERQGATGDHGVEDQIAAQAPARAVRKALETPEQQLQLLASGSEREQIASLKVTLDEIENDPKAFDDLIAAWLAGDSAVLIRDQIEPLRRATPALYRKLLRDRNTAWTRQILDRLQGSGRTVMVVGAGHLIGRDGVPAMLRARGVKVEGP